MPILSGVVAIDGNFQTLIGSRAEFISGKAKKMGASVAADDLPNGNPGWLWDDRNAALIADTCNQSA